MTGKHTSTTPTDEVSHMTRALVLLSIPLLIGAAALALIVANNDDSSKEPESEVLGVQINRPKRSSTTSTTEAASAITAGEVPAVAPAVAPPAPTVAAPAAPAPAQTIRAPRTTSGTRTITETQTQTITPAAPQGVPYPSSRGTFIENSDNGFYFMSGSVGSGSATSMRKGEHNHLLFYVGGSEVRTNVGRFTTSLTNQTDRDMYFPGGLTVNFIVSHNGNYFTTVKLHRPDVTVLPAFGELNGFVESFLNGPGQYSFTGSVAVEYR